MNMISSSWQYARFRYGLYWPKSRPPIPVSLLFRATMAAAIVTMALTNQDLTERVAVMEQVTEIYEAKVTTLEACERGAQGYYYSDGRTFECPMKL